MQATFAAGATLNVVFRDAERHHKVKATVAGGTDAVVLLDLGDVGARPRLGDPVTLVAGSRIFDTIVNRVDERWTTVRRPVSLAVDDQRRALRSATKLSVRWRLAGAPASTADAAYVVDLSPGGLRILTEARPDRAPGQMITVDIGKHHLDGCIRRVTPHEHGQLHYFGVEFAPMSIEAKQYLLKTIGKVRIGEHDWA
jgi:hypothetical protein